jgi:hypothetical protein
VRAVSAPLQCWQLSGSTLDFLSGSWHADRVLTDYRSGQVGSFRGVASFVERPGDRRGGLAYHEQGELHFGSHRGPAGRSLLYLPGSDGAAAVLFADGRPFYQLDLRSGYWRAEHPCGSDHYLVTVRVVGPDAFTEHWQARGPGKDYVMTTSLARIGAPE